MARSYLGTPAPCARPGLIAGVASSCAQTEDCYGSRSSASGRGFCPGAAFIREIVGNDFTDAAASAQGCAEA
jgi:hypothetical protein